ncbi:response regulator transcription factor [Halalkaliarchaeum desulfuricum]|nr:response regulator transcription factor [Halalkaliarchaeum desulfuricum]
MKEHGPERDSDYRLLVVDDQTAIRDLLEHRLETEGFDVETVSDGRSALDQLREEGTAFDAVVLDVSMPNMDGFETLRRIQNLDRPPLTMMVSGRKSEREQIRAFELGAVDYVTKPFKPRVLVVRLESHLDRYWGNAPGSDGDSTARKATEEETTAKTTSAAETGSEPETDAETEDSEGDDWPGSWTPGVEGDQ